MDSKVIALLMSTVMIFASVVVLIDDVNATDDGTIVSSVDKGTVYVKAGYTTTVNFNITEPDYGYFDNVVTWNGQNIGTPIEVVEDDETIATIIVTGNEGEYTATITGKDGGTYTDFKLKYTISTDTSSNPRTDNSNNADANAEVGSNSTEDNNSVNSEEDVTSQKSSDNEATEGNITQSIVYTMDIVVIESPLPNPIEKPTNGESNSDYNNKQGGLFNNTVEVQYGDKLVPTQIAISNDDDFVYYAISLPKGLQMAPDGYISGTPVDSEYGASREITVVATHIASNQSYTAKYTMTIQPADTNIFTFKVYGDDIKIAGERYITISGEDFYVRTFAGDSSSPIDVDHVYVIKNDGTLDDVISSIKESAGFYKLDSYGSGEFTVVLVKGDYSQSFQVVAIAQSTDVYTGIGFAPNTSIDNNSNENESVVKS